MTPKNQLSKNDMFTPMPGIMWKKCMRPDGNEVVLMMAAENMKVAYECTASAVTCIAIYDMWGYKTDLKTCSSPIHPEFVYRVGKRRKGPIWGYETFEKAQRKWVGQYGASKDDRYMELATEGGRRPL